MRFKAKRLINGLDENKKAKVFPIGSLLPKNVTEWPTFRAMSRGNWLAPIYEDEVRELEQVELEAQKAVKLEKEKERQKSRVEPTGLNTIPCDKCGGFFKSKRAVTTHKKSCSGSII